MKIRLNENKEIADMVKEGVEGTRRILPMPPGDDRRYQMYV